MTYRRAALLAGAALALSAPAAHASDPTPAQALAELNAWRALAGENPVPTLDPLISAGCRLHNAYMIRNGRFDHGEDPLLPGWTPLGEQAGASSVLATVSPGAADPRHAWEAAVYHRVSLLDPRLVRTGFDASGGYACMGIAGTSDGPAQRTPGLALYPWPANGLRGVPVAFEGVEIPSPYDAVPGATRLGTLLSVNVNGPWKQLEGTRLSSVSLTPDGGAPVPVTGVNGWAISPGFGIFPKLPLRAGTWYTARAAGVVTGSDNLTAGELPFDLSWRFQTAGEHPLTGFDADDGTIYTWTASTAPLRVTITRGRSTVARRDLGGEARWKTGLPGGLYRVCAHQPAAGRYAGFDACKTMAISTVAISGRLRSGVLIASVTAKPARRVSVSLKRPKRVCAASGCATTWIRFRTLKTRGAVRVKVPYRRVQVAVRVPGAVRDGVRYRAKRAAKIIVDRPQALRQTDTCWRLSAVNGSRCQPLQRASRVNPAIRAIRSSSEGHT